MTQAKETLISVIIPTYRHAALIGETLESVFAQTHGALQVIVINDGSPDNTEDALRPYIDSGRIEYIRQANAGQATARNLGISKARGDFIALLDDDDLIPPDKLSCQLALLHEDPEAVLAYGLVVPFTRPEDLAPEAMRRHLEHQSGHPAPTGDVLPAFKLRNWIVSPGQTLIRRSALEQIGGFDPEIWGADDYDLYVRLARIGRFAFTRRISLYYRKHAGNASRNLDKMYDNIIRVHAKHWPFRLSELGSWLRFRAYQGRYFCMRYVDTAQTELGVGNFHNARVQLRRALQIYPPALFRRTWLRAAWSALKAS